MIGLISLLLLALQVVLSRFNYRYALILFIAIVLIFPTAVKFTDVLNLSVARTSIFLQLILFFTQKRSIKSKKESLVYPFWMQTIVFSVLIIPSFLFTQFSSGFPKGLYDYTLYFFVDHFLVGIILFYSINNIEDAKTVFRGVLIALFIMGVYGLYEYLTDYNNVFWNIIEKEFKIEKVYNYEDIERFGFNNRIKSTNVHPIVYGGRLANLIPFFMMFMLYFSYWKIKGVKMYFVLLVFGLVVVNIFLTVSRSCWIAALMSMLIIYIADRKVLFKKSLFFRVGLYILLPLAVYLILPQFSSQSAVASDRGSNTAMRLDQFDYIFNIILNKQIFLGFGPEAIKMFLLMGQHPDALGFESFIFEAFVSNGLLGFIGYVFLYTALFRFVYKIKGAPINKWYMYALFISHLVFIITTGERETFFVFWMVACFFVKLLMLMTPKPTVDIPTVDIPTIDTSTAKQIS